MKRTREERGITLRQIATATKLSVGALEALERNDISRLPGGIFSRAFVRSYAVEVGLDPELTVKEFLTQFPHDSVTAGSPHVPQEDHVAIESSRRSAETALKLAAISLPIVGVILYVTLVREPGPLQETQQQTPQGTSQEGTPQRDAIVAPVEASEPVSSPAVPPSPASAEPLTFEIVATGPVSVDVAVDDVARESRALIQGERLVVQAHRQMRLSMSDAGAVQLSINGQPTVALGKSGETRAVAIGPSNYGAFLASQ